MAVIERVFISFQNHGPVGSSGIREVDVLEAHLLHVVVDGQNSGTVGDGDLVAGIVIFIAALTDDSHGRGCGDSDCFGVGASRDGDGRNSTALGVRNGIANSGELTTAICGNSHSGGGSFLEVSRYSKLEWTINNDSLGEDVVEVELDVDVEVEVEIEVDVEVEVEVESNEDVGVATPRGHTACGLAAAVARPEMARRGRRKRILTSLQRQPERPRNLSSQLSLLVLSRQDQWANIIKTKLR